MNDYLPLESNSKILPYLQRKYHTVRCSIENRFYIERSKIVKSDSVKPNSLNLIGADVAQYW